MKYCLLLVFSTAFSGVPAFADGIYVTGDLKHARYEHTVIVLNQEQIKDVERLRKVVLTEAQMKPLRAIYQKTPNELEVLSSRWDLCTCDIGAYGIWCRVGELDVPHSSLEAQRWYNEDAPEFSTEENENADSGIDEDQSEEEWVSIGEGIILDSKGDMFLEGKKISEEALRKRIDEIATTEVRARTVSRYIHFDLPPPISEDIDERILELVQRTNTYCRERDVAFHAMGMHLE